MDDEQFKLNCRLVIKNIPENISDEYFQEILNNNFAKHIKDNSLMIKLNKKYSTKKKNKMCFFTVDSLETRLKIIDFFSTFELIDPKGMKQKVIINDCLLQTRIKSDKDTIENTLNECEHFLQFKEFLSNDKLVDFKGKEEEFCKDLYEGIIEIPSLKKDKEEETSNNNNNTKQRGGKIVIMKKNNNDDSNEKNKQDDNNSKIIINSAINGNSTCEIEIIPESNSNYNNNNKHHHKNNNNRGQKNKGKYNNSNSNNDYYNYNDGYGNSNDDYYYSNANSSKSSSNHKKGGYQNNSNNNSNNGGYYDNGYYYDNNDNAGGNKGYRKGGYKKGAYK